MMTSVTASLEGQGSRAMRGETIVRSLTRRIEHSEYLWHMLNDNRSPRGRRSALFNGSARRSRTNFLFALILCDELSLDVFASFSVFIFALVFGETFSEEKRREGKRRRMNEHFFSPCPDLKLERVIFSANRSFLFKKRMIDVLTNHLLLQIESNRRSDSCIRFVVSSSTRT